MSDLIDRQAAIEALDKRFDDVPMELTTEILQLRRDLRERIPSAQPEQRWIPCSEGLPDEEYVLISKKPKNIFDGGRCVTIAIRMEDPRSRKVNWRDIGFGVIPDYNVLAWMPLPEPYGGDQNETD